MNFDALLLTNIGTTNSVITTDRYRPIIMVGGDFSCTVGFVSVAGTDNNN